MKRKTKSQCLDFLPGILWLWLFLCLPVTGEAQMPDGPADFYLMHSGGNHMAKGTDGGAILQSPDAPGAQMMHFVPDGKGYYTISPVGGTGYLSLSGQWNTLFSADASSDASKYAIEKSGNSFIKLKCKANQKYLGTDNTTAGAKIYSDKDGTDTRHLWYLAENPAQEPPADTAYYVVNPAARLQAFEGWGVSFCWWANMCGQWSDEKIDELVDWLVSPTGLNFRIFRYNIGGGDDPQNRHCTPHHMKNGKGLRAEMEGFKDSLNGEYIWSRDSAQRKIMLKIKAKRPDAIFEAFSNSGPYYMTYSGCCAGNTNASKDNLKPEYYEAFARYLVDVCRHYKEKYGIEFRTLDPFNEPMTNYWAANGGQEGCHFDMTSQTAFLKVLHPILEASGLQTVISASDETDVAQSVKDFNGYDNDQVLDLVGQWNTHTYSAERQSRSQICALCKERGLRLWMSEVGSGGTGISGNLDLAQKLIDDVRYLMPSAWVDWQYMEEDNDQWCLVEGNFMTQDYHKVKNFSIRQHFSRFIQPGYTYLATQNGQTLAARNPEGDSLIIVVLNPTALPVTHQADLSFYSSVNGDITALRTSETEDLVATNDYTLEDRMLTYRLPAYSITTYLIPVTEAPEADNAILPDKSYWICPRNAADQSIQASDGQVTLQPIGYNAEQIWQLHSAGKGYTFINKAGYILTDRSPQYALDCEKQTETGQTFLLSPIDDIFQKISTEDDSKSLDLEGEHYTAGTVVGLWAYGSSVTASHRQWFFMRLPEEGLTDGVRPINLPSTDANCPIIINSETKGVLHVTRLQHDDGELSIYTSSGMDIYHHPLRTDEVLIPLSRGIYIVRYQTNQLRFSRTVGIK